MEWATLAAHSALPSINAARKIVTLWASIVSHRLPLKRKGKRSYYRFPSLLLPLTSHDRCLNDLRRTLEGEDPFCVCVYKNMVTFTELAGQ